MARAMGAALFAEPIPAARAAGWGMIWEAVPDEDFDARWRARAAHLASGPTAAYARVKEALRASFAGGLDAGRRDVRGDQQQLRRHRVEHRRQRRGVAAPAEALEVLFGAVHRRYSTRTSGGDSQNPRTYKRTTAPSTTPRHSRSRSTPFGAASP